MRRITAGFKTESGVLYHGDCLDIMPDLPDGCADMILADLPYGITACHWDTAIPMEPIWAQYKRLIKEDGAVVLTGIQPFTSELVMSNREWFKYEWIWEKTVATGFLSCSFMPMKCHENILVFYGKRPTYNPQKQQGEPWHIGKTMKARSSWGKQYPHISTNPSGLRFPRSVMKIRNPNYKSQHRTRKPEQLFEYMIKTYTNEGETILDNTIGSGTTAIAAHNTGRRWIGIEKDAEIYETACQRIANETAQMQMPFNRRKKEAAQ